jgi:1-acyl-sn-glycerol-3-phosphate acyltransferase
MSREAAMDLRAAMPAGYSAAAYHCSKWALRLVAHAWLRLRIEGARNAPRSGPLLLVGNHSSYLDPPLLGVGIPRPVLYLAQKGLAKVGLLRWWMRKVGVGLIDRNAPSKEVLRTLSEALAAGACVAMFPEGTRSQDGRVAPFRSGVEFLVRRTGATVLPIGIEGAFRAFPRGAAFPRPKKCIVRIGTPWSKDQVLAPGGIEALRQEVARLARCELAEAPSPAQVVTGPGADSSDPSRSNQQPSAGGRP